MIKTTSAPEHESPRRFDVAVLRLDSPVTYAAHIAPICLPQVGRDPEVRHIGVM